MSLIEILSLMYREMEAGEYDCEVSLKMKRFDKRWDKCSDFLKAFPKD